MEYVELNNGVQMPMLGFGVYQISDVQECEKCVLDAIEVGYRLIDTAQGYGNEEAVGIAIKKSGVPREELFITTKIWISNAGYENARISIEESLMKLQLDYLDLILIHQPYNDYYGTYRAMEELYKAGKLKAIGVSNFYSDRLIDLIKHNEIVPAVNQVEAHVFHQQDKAHQIMDEYQVHMQAWAPFAEGRNNFFAHETLMKIGAQYNKTAAQVALRFLMDKGISVLPKTVSRSRMAQNFDVFDFKLSQADHDTLAALDLGKSQFFSHTDPVMVEYLTSL